MMFPPSKSFLDVLNNIGLEFKRFLTSLACLLTESIFRKSLKAKLSGFDSLCKLCCVCLFFT